MFITAVCTLINDIITTYEGLNRDVNTRKQPLK